MSANKTEHPFKTETLAVGGQKAVYEITCKCGAKAHVLGNRWNQSTRFDSLEDIIEVLRDSARQQRLNAERPRIHQPTRNAHLQTAEAYDKMASVLSEKLALEKE